MSKMSRSAQVAFVIAGYVGACLAASGAVYVNGLLTPADVKLNSSGMSAFGDVVLFVGSLGVCAFFPTALGLYFLAAGFMSRKRNDQDVIR